MSHLVATLFATAIRGMTNGQSGIGAAVRAILRHPIKVVASFVFAPLLALRVARVAKNPIRRAIAGAGILLGCLAAWVAGTALGTVAGALVVASKFGPVLGLGLLVGTLTSIFLSVAFMVVSFNATCFLFLKMSQKDVVDYLVSISK